MISTSIATSAKLLSFPHLAEAQHKIIMVASGKGGVGKTCLSISLAHALAEEGKKVLLFDGDLGLANVDIQLGLMPSKDLGSVIMGQSTLEQIIMHYKPAQIDIIAGRSGCGTLSSLSPERLAYLQTSLKDLAFKYDVIMMDLGAGVGGTVRSLSRIANECFVVITDEPTSLTDAYAFIKLTRSHMPLLPLKILVNQADSLEAGDHTYQTIKKVCENFLHFIPELAGIVRRDQAVREAIRHQSPLLTRHVNTNASEDIRKIVKNK